MPHSSFSFTITLFFIALTLLLNGFLGLERFGQSDFVKTGFPLLIGDIGGYDFDEFIGIIATAALPLGVFFFFLASSISRGTFSNGLSHIFISLLTLLGAFLFYQRWNAKNLLDCGVFLCAFYGPESKKTDTANGYYQSK